MAKRKSKKSKHQMSVIHSHEFSPMARVTQTPSKQARQHRQDRRNKQQGWTA